MAFFTKYFWCNFQAKLTRTSSKVCRWDLGDATWQYNLIVVCQMPSHRMDWIYKSDCMGHLLHVCGSAWHLSHTCPWRCENLNGSRWPCGAFARQMHAGWRDCTVTWRKEDDREITVLVFSFLLLFADFVVLLSLAPFCSKWLSCSHFASFPSHSHPLALCIP